MPDDDFADVILQAEQMASQRFLLQAVRKKFDHDLAFRSCTTTVQWHPEDYRYRVKVDFPFGTKTYSAESWVVDDELAAMKTKEDFQAIIKRVHGELRNWLRVGLQADGINDLPIAPSPGESVLDTPVPTRAQRTEIMGWLQS